ncbi:HK97-gp10 family putative phage morphogenesis protein [Bacillus sp. CGMCC 1.60114]|uniref:HK97-gp10 family putative phage morphogenesis protein n=1 Tax=unclassified Bacillus (in: firmicutes) TaxID=185979 RepID=UPI003641B5EA
MAGIEVFGVDQWIRQLEDLGKNVNKITKDALQAGAEVFDDRLEANSPVGPEPQQPTINQSWRDGKHAKDAIKKGKIVKKGSMYSIEVGWDKADRSPHFYMKFQNWGTSKKPNPPHKGFVEKTILEVEKEVLAAMNRAFMDAITR